MNPLQGLEPRSKTMREEIHPDDDLQTNRGLQETWSSAGIEGPGEPDRRTTFAGTGSTISRVDPPPKPELSFDVGVLTKALFEKARRESSLEIIPAVQRELIVNALEATAGNYAQAAELLGITRSTLRKRVGKFEIKQEFTVR